MELSFWLYCCAVWDECHVDLTHPSPVKMVEDYIDKFEFECIFVIQIFCRRYLLICCYYLRCARLLDTIGLDNGFSSNGRLFIV